jgi:hypothetical protein
MAPEIPNDMVTSSPSIRAGSARGSGTAYLIGVAVRPTLLFMTAFVLNVTPHEAAHAKFASCWPTPSETEHALFSRWSELSHELMTGWTGF